MGGGAERTVSNLINGLHEEFDVTLVLMNKTIDYTIPINQKIEFIEQSNVSELEAIKLLKIPYLAYKFARYCNKNSIEVVLSVMNRPNYVATMAKIFGLKSKVLISEQFYTPYFCNNQTFAGKVKSYLLKNLYPKADLILPNSKSTETALKNNFNIQTAYQVIKNPTNIEHILKKQHELVEDISFEHFTFVKVAAFREEKNHHLLLNAFKELKGEKCQLLLIGKGKLKPEIQSKVQELGLEDQVKFIEFTINPYKYLSKAHCFVMSSNGEGFPNVLIEAMACSLPIISVDCHSGPRELLAPSSDFNIQITEGIEFAEYGILVPVKNELFLSLAMKEVFNNNNLLEDYRSKLVERAKLFDQEVVIADFKKIIKNILT
jgi:N-acetylgalactosamine-N,N'-diacetylbacillosaminyl-diphospho-undecaprenol 4-alpha-N-acetylgalactosaminyltransferase